MLRIHAVQANPIVGDLNNNRNIMQKHYQNASSKNVDIVLFPELMLTGYSPEDLMLRPDFIRKTMHEAEQIAMQTTEGTALIFGCLWQFEGEICSETNIPMPSALKNCAIVAWGGKIQHIIEKTDLPNFGVFDERRYFKPATKRQVFTFKNTCIGVPICRDTWLPDVCNELAELGAELLLSPNASPYELDKEKQRIAFIEERVNKTCCPLVYLNLIGGQDEVVFDGKSFAMSPQNNKPIQLAAWQEDVAELHFESGEITSNHKTVWPTDAEEDLFNACVLGLRDYVFKNGFRKVCLGLSGGVDSALVAVICAEALGSENVQTFYMPSPYSAQASKDDAFKLTDNINIQINEVNISSLMEIYNSTLSPVLGDLKGVTAENIQSRSRGVLMMALSNHTGALLITTGNKSEYATGYATIYGDMCGAFNPIKDLYKTQVYSICKWINRKSEIIPERIITRPPSAELRPEQTDQDSLPDYDVLDAILTAAIEDKQSSDDIINKGFDAQTVKQVLHLLKISEYKRRQAAPGVKVSKQAFGREWRYPMTNRHSF